MSGDNGVRTIIDPQLTGLAVVSAGVRTTTEVDMRLLGDERPLLVAAPKGRTRVAIVGFSPATRDLAPYDDPDVEVWGLNQLYRHIPRASRWFEMHQREDFLADVVPGTDYLGWLAQVPPPTPLYMIAAADDLPAAVPYPITRTAAHVGRWYLTSTPAFMLALAIAEGFEEIGLYGIDLVVNEEYYHQKPCMEYLLGWWEGYMKACGRQAKLVLPERCALLKASYHYGYEREPNTGLIRPWMTRTRQAELKEKVKEFETRLHQLEGHISEAEIWKTKFEEAGVVVPKQALDRLAALRKDHETGLAAFYTASGQLHDTDYWHSVLENARKVEHIVYDLGPDLRADHSGPAYDIQTP